jgi:methoxymalonate biosynthesis protein
VSAAGRGHRLAVVGAGTMGTGIAALALGRGLDVVLVDVDDGILAAARSRVSSQLRLARLMGSLPRGAGAGGAGGADGELRTSTAIADIAGCSAVVESVVERAEVKATVLAEAAAAVEPGTLLVSNTSAIPIDELAGATGSPADLVGVHFMNPPYLIRTVEVIRGPRTGEPAMAAVATLLAALDREPVVVGDGPGFVINRILQRMINEAARIVAEGIATPEAVAAVFTGCLGHRTGPLGTADLIGLDNVVDALTVLHERTGDAGYRPAALLVEKVRAGELGRKSGRGFFEHGSPL